MRALLFLLTVALVACVATATPIDPERWLINRPTEEPYLRFRRANQNQNVKGGEAPVKGRVQLTRSQPSLRKGEYVCGDKICKLQPGEVPKGCKGICQYQLPLVRN